MFGGSAYLFAIIKYFPSLFFYLLLLQRNFFHTGYVIKPLQPSSAIYGAPPITGNLNLLFFLLLMLFRSICYEHFRSIC